MTTGIKTGKSAGRIIDAAFVSPERRQQFQQMMLTLRRERKTVLDPAKDYSHISQMLIVLGYRELRLPTWEDECEFYFESSDSTMVDAITDEYLNKVWKWHDRLYRLGYYSEARQLRDFIDQDVAPLTIRDWHHSLPEECRWKQADNGSIHAVSGGLCSPR